MPNRTLVALSAALVIVITASTGPAPTMASDATTVSVWNANEAPGGLARAIVTAWNPPAGYSVELTVRASDGATATCVGESWHNPIRDSLSRKCYVALPLREGDYVLVGIARFSRPGEADVVVEGAGTRPVRAYGAPSPEPMSIEHAEKIDRCWNETDRVQVTFDDGANRTKLLSILSTLRANDVLARFFFTGKYAKEHPGRMSRLRRAGHLLGNHTYGHVNLQAATKETVLDQIDRGVAATTDPLLLRPPYGAGALTTRLENLAAERSYRLCGWTVDTRDWEGAPVETLVERVQYGDYRTPPIAAGGVIMMHGGGDFTYRALQKIIDVVRGNGLELERRPGS